MPQGLAIQLARDAIVLAIVISGPLLAVAVGVGILVSIIQTVTQIQEQTLSFVPKLLSVAIAFLATFSWMLQRLTTYAVELYVGMSGLAL